ncbi:MAG: protein kinase [Coleofasciculus chthonoplastes F3-SA18-01]|uniref:protein kinase domain-containing protein n=1 Tax=Coleofasciculus chthonoplastes TaxID=64178 RepID=UPI0032FE57A4
MVWATGQKLQGGKYVIQGVLGQGGFGITYKARHVSLNHYVVIKTPNEYLQYEPDYHKYVDRFIAEAQVLARLSRDPHPSIVGVHDLFQEGIISCLVMNFVDGENLFELVRRRGAIPEAEAVRYIRQIGEALTLVHQVGLTHRDAHPGNILLRQNGKAVLIDFGIAKELVPSTYTSTGAVGNEGFAPYEQVHRGSREPNVDVYCLAATLYYALTGQCPTKGLDRKLYQEPLIEPRRIVPGISKQVNRAILKGMALEPKKRPQSMQAWLKKLDIPKVFTPLSNDLVHKTKNLVSVFNIKKQLDFNQSKSKYYIFVDDYFDYIIAENARANKIMLVVICFSFIVFVASITPSLYTSIKASRQEYQALKNVFNLNRAQQLFFYENGKYSTQKEELKTNIKSTDSYIYSSYISIVKEPKNLINKSLDKLGLGISDYKTKTYIQGVFNYGISRNNNLKSYVGAVVVRELSKIDEPITLSILCESKSLDTPPPEPIHQNGKLACSSGTQEVSP